MPKLNRPNHKVHAAEVCAFPQVDSRSGLFIGCPTIEDGSVTDGFQIRVLHKSEFTNRWVGLPVCDHHPGWPAHGHTESTEQTLREVQNFGMNGRDVVVPWGKPEEAIFPQIVGPHRLYRRERSSSFRIGSAHGLHFDTAHRTAFRI